MTSTPSRSDQHDVVIGVADAHVGLTMDAGNRTVFLNHPTSEQRAGR